MKTCWFIVIASKGSWWIDCEGKSYGPLDDRQAAIENARRIAQTYGDPKRRADIWVPDDDRKMQLHWSGPAPQEE